MSIFLAPIKSNAQQTVSFDRISLETETRTMYISTIIQDSKGIIWLGTFGGLVKYDGYSLKTYKHNPEDPNSEDADDIKDLIEDSEGTIWVGNGDGRLEKFDRNSGSFINFSINPSDTIKTDKNGAFCILEDRQNNLWIGTLGDGLRHINKTTGEVAHYKIDTKSLFHDYNNAIFSIYETPDNKLLVGTQRRGLWEFDRENKSFAFIQHLPDSEEDYDEESIYSFYDSMTIRSLLKDSSGGLWLGTDNGLFYSEGDDSEFTRFENDPNDPHSFDGKQVLSIVEDLQGYIWIATNDAGLSRYDRDLNRFEQFKSDSSPGSLSNDSITSLFCDNLGTIWVGVSGFGLHKYSPLKHNFPHYTRVPNNPNSLSDPKVYSLLEDKNGTVWIGTLLGGLNSLDRSTNTFNKIQEGADGKNGLRNETVFSLCEDDQGVLWIGTVFGIDRMDLSTGTITHLEEDQENPHIVPETITRVIHMDRNNTIWVGTVEHGLYQYDRKNDRFIRYVHNPDDPTSISSDTIKSIYHSRSGDLWIGTAEGGLNRFLPDENEFVRYSHDPDDRHSLNDSSVQCIYEDNEGLLWLGTRKGVNRFDPETGKSISYSVKDGLIDNVIYGILPESDYLLWMSTNKGLSRFNIKSRKFENFDHNFGLQNDEFNTGAYFKNAKGELFFGGQKGFHIFRPETVIRNKIPPQLIFKSFSVYNIDMLTENEGANHKEIKLPFDQNSIALEYAALDYINPATNRYAYKLEGVDRSWVDAGTRRLVNYSSLSPGSYVFRVKGANSHGYWNNDGASLRFTILPPYWDTWWFRTAIGLLIVGALVSVYLLRIDSLNRRGSELAKKVDDRTKALKLITQELEAFSYSVSHDLRTPLWHINLFGKLIKKNQYEKLDTEGKNHLEILINSSTNSLQIIEDLLYLSLPDNNELRISSVDLSRLANEVASEFIKIETDRKVNFEVQESMVADCDERLIAIVLRNLFSNSLKFTRSREQAVVRFFSFIHEGLNCFAVNDNGIGINTEESDDLFKAFQRSPEAKGFEGYGVGLETCRRIIDRHGGTIKAEGQENKGATIMFTLP